MKNLEKKTDSIYSGFTYDPSLDAYEGKSMFPRKIAEATAFIEKVGLPKEYYDSLERNKQKETPVLLKKMAEAIKIMEKTGLPSESLIEEARQASLAARKLNGLADIPKPIATKTSTSIKPRRKKRKKKALSV
jgi:transcriptional regulator with XRE-family HTH domain